MKKYKVEIEVLGIGTTSVEVEARDSGKALKLAEEILYNSELEWEFKLNGALPPKMSVGPA